MTPWVLRLLIANVVVFMVAQPGTLLYQYLAFAPAWILRQPWSPFTYMFLHAGFMHILFNMIMLYFFGPRLESRIGSRDFIILYVVAGLSGALFSFLTPGAAIVGASGAILGVMYGFAHYWPQERIYIWGILPIPAWGLVVGMAGISIWFGLAGGGSVAHFAHLGGLAGGWGYLKLRERRSKSFQRKATADSRPSTVAKVTGKAGRAEKKWEDIRLDDLHEINRSEVERIRQKIEEEGAGSLTPDERAFMNRMAG
ncbi:MAG: rhomboid family intramembrane serine protease [Longimicrobiales bacterium]